MAIADRATRAGQSRAADKTIFRHYALGVSTNRDDWLYDIDAAHLSAKVKYLLRRYKETGQSNFDAAGDIKWSESLKRRKLAHRHEGFHAKAIQKAEYRPFSFRHIYRSELLIDRLGGADVFFPRGVGNFAICFSDIGSRTDFCVLAVDRIADLHFGAAVDAYQQVARYRYVGGERIDNVTDWAQAQFQAHYAGTREAAGISKDAIFHYVYGVLHDPRYRETFAENLKQSFPRVPFYPDFSQWAEWGDQLMHLHVGYESADPWPLRRIDMPDEAARRAGVAPKVLLKSDPTARTILLDSETQLGDIPAEAWAYRLGNRSGIDWVLDQHKERAPKDPTIRARFNTYRFADHKERVIDLLARVVRVSVETVAITEAMRSHPRAGR